MPVECGVVRRCERKPYQKTAKTNVLNGPVMADIGSAKSEAEQELGGEDTPGRLDFPGAPIFRIRQSKGKQQQDRNDDEGGFQLAGSSGSAAIVIYGRIKVGIRGNVEEDRNTEQESDTGELRNPRGKCRRPILQQRKSKNQPESNQRKGKKHSRISGPIEE